MRFANTFRILGLLLAGVITSACGSDPNQPTTLQQQQAAMHPAPPSADALKNAMSKVHFKTPGSDAKQAPPAGTTLPGDSKGGK
ncbi:MAG: hypothetical protein ACYC96_08720 [Fimbriimonadaceae bacterium]